MNNILISITLTLLLVALVGMEQTRQTDRPTVPTPDSCTACHTMEAAPLSAGHDVGAMGCSPCHMGNGQAFEKRRAHHGMVSNPGDLRVVDATCGRGGCHPALAARIKTSVMATAAGMLRALDILWGTRGPRDAALLWAEETPRDAPRDYWAKLCAACHLWWPKGRGLGEQRLRGGGCSACHVAGPKPPRLEQTGLFRHSRLTMMVPMENCVRCHNRSARIGLSYQGLAEDNGSGGPHAAGALNPLRLSGGRYAMHIRPDVHFTAGMICIDCHTGTEIMGDGTAHPRLRGQLDVACADCHTPRFMPASSPYTHPAGRDAQTMRATRAEGMRLTALNPALPALRDAPLAYTAARSTPLYALRLKTKPRTSIPGQAVLHRKTDGKALDIPLHNRPQPHHALRGHERLSCQSCHSPLIPQCYGCHVTLRADTTQTDLLLGDETPGRWEERLDHARLRNPGLALRDGRRIVPYSPCEVSVTVAGADGVAIPGLSRSGMTMTPFDPHTTRTRSRTCLDCHLPPTSKSRTAPLAHGKDGMNGPAIRGAHDASSPAITTQFAPKRTAPPNDTTGHRLPESGDRALCEKEMAAIYSVAPCLPCHGRYDDPVYLDFHGARDRIRHGDAPRCGYPAPSIWRNARRTDIQAGDTALSTSTH